MLYDQIVPSKFSPHIIHPLLCSPQQYPYLVCLRLARNPDMVCADADEEDDADRRDAPRAGKVIELHNIVILDQRDKAQGDPRHAADSKAQVLGRLALVWRQREQADDSNNKESDATLITISTKFADYDKKLR